MKKRNEARLQGLSSVCGRFQIRSPHGTDQGYFPYWSIIVLRNYFKIAFRNLHQYRRACIGDYRLSLCVFACKTGEKAENLEESKGIKFQKTSKELNTDYEVSTVLNLVTYYGNIEQKDKIVELFEQTIKDNENLKSIYASTIVRMEIADKYDYAIEMMKAEVEKEENANSAYLWNTLGQLYEKKGDIETALIHVRKAAELSKGATYYAREITRLEKLLQNHLK